MKKTMLITPQMLAAHGACFGSQQRLRELFPGGVVPTESLVRQNVRNFGWSWGIQLLLKGEHRETALEEEEVVLLEREGLCNAAYVAHDTSTDDNRYRVLGDTLDKLYADSHLKVALIFLRHFVAQGGCEMPEETP